MSNALPFSMSNVSVPVAPPSRTRAGEPFTWRRLATALAIRRRAGWPPSRA